MLQGPTNIFEIDFTSKLSFQQHVKYGSNLMEICYYFFGGGPGEPYAESRGTKVSRKPHHICDTSTRKNSG